MKKTYYNLITTNYRGERLEYNINKRKELMKTYCSIIELVLIRFCGTKVIEILRELLEEFEEEELYQLKCKYNIPDCLLEGKSLIINLSHNYNLEYLALFDYILFVYKTHGGDWIHRFYSYIKITKTNNKFKWLITKPIQQQLEGSTRKGFFNNKNIEYLEHLTFGSSISFNVNGEPKFDCIFENIMKFQNDTDFQNYSQLVTFIDHNYLKSTIYIPNDILIKLDKNYFDSITSGKYITNDYDIILTENESYLSFLLFFKDYLKFSQITIQLNNIIDIQKLFVADRFNYLNIYDYDYFTDIQKVLLLLSSNFYSSTLVDKIIIKLISKSTTYSSLSKFTIPNHLLSELSIKVDNSLSCDIKFLFQFKDIQVLTDNYNYSTAKIIHLSDSFYRFEFLNVHHVINLNEFSTVSFHKSRPLFSK